MGKEESVVVGCRKKPSSSSLDRRRRWRYGTVSSVEACIGGNVGLNLGG